MVKEIQPPHKIQKESNDSIKIFLGGTIDMGLSHDWQSTVKEYLESSPLLNNKNITLLNPRRTDWDSNWSQKYEDPQFYQQVNWELNALEKSNLIILNFLPGSKSPITLMELGLFAGSGKVKVCCPEGYWRKGNVDIVCERYGIEIFENFDELLKSLWKWV